VTRGASSNPEDQLTSTKSVLITGAAGFVGSHLAERCLRDGWRVIAVDSFTPYYSPSIKRSNASCYRDHENCTFMEADLLNLDLVDLLTGVEIVFHLAAQPGIGRSWEAFDAYTEANLTLTQRLLDAATVTAPERFVMASSSSVYGDAERLPTAEAVILAPVSPYGVTKAAAEHLAYVYWRSFGVATVMLRYFTVYGPRQRPDMAFHRVLQAALRAEEFSVYGDGEQTRDFTYVADAVEGTVAAGLRGEPGRAYNLGGGAPWSMNQVFELVSSIGECRLRLRYVDRQHGDARDTAASIERARSELGYEPAQDLPTGLRRQFEWQREAAVLLEPTR